MVDWPFVVGLGIFTALVNAVVWAVALIGARKRPRQDRLSGELIAEYGTGARILAVALGMFPVPILVAATRFFTNLSAVQQEGRTWLFVLGFFLVFSLPFSIEFFGVSHRLTHEGILKRSPWSKKFHARWEDILSVRYSMAFDGYIVRTVKGTIRLSSYLRGIHEILGILTERAPQAFPSIPRKDE